MKAEEFSSREEHEADREKFTWGSYGRDGDEPLVRRPISDLSSNHIYNIMRTQQLGVDYYLLFIRELIYRGGE